MQPIDHLKFVAESPRTASLIRHVVHKINTGLSANSAFQDLAQQLSIGFGVKASASPTGIRVTSPTSRARKPAQLLITRQGGQRPHPDASVVVSTYHMLMEVFDKGEGYGRVEGDSPLASDRG